MAFKTRQESVLEGSASGGGRVRAWTSDKEPGKLSLAVVGDRAVMTHAEARELARWLLQNASREETGFTTAQHTMAPHENEPRHSNPAFMWRA